MGTIWRCIGMLFILSVALGMPYMLLFNSTPTDVAKEIRVLAKPADDPAVNQEAQASLASQRPGSSQLVPDDHHGHCFAERRETACR
jgi:hypothetical protein